MTEKKDFVGTNGIQKFCGNLILCIKLIFEAAHSFLTVRRTVIFLDPSVQKCIQYSIF